MTEIEIAIEKLTLISINAIRKKEGLYPIDNKAFEEIKDVLSGRDNFTTIVEAIVNALGIEFVSKQSKLANLYPFEIVLGDGARRTEPHSKINFNSNKTWLVSQVVSYPREARELIGIFNNKPVIFIENIKEAE